MRLYVYCYITLLLMSLGAPIPANAEGESSSPDLSALTDQQLYNQLSNSSALSKSGDRVAMDKLDQLSRELDRRELWAQRNFTNPKASAEDKQRFRDEYLKYKGFESTVINNLRDYGPSGAAATIEDVADVIMKDPTAVTDPKALARNLLLKKFEKDYIANLHTQGVPDPVARSYWKQVMEDGGFTKKIDATIDTSLATTLADGADLISDHLKNDKLKDILNSDKIIEKTRLLNRIAGPLNLIQDGLDAYTINEQLGWLNSNNDNVVSLTRQLRDTGLPDARIVDYFQTDPAGKREILKEAAVTPETEAQLPILPQAPVQEQIQTPTGPILTYQQSEILSKLHGAYTDGSVRLEGMGSFSLADIQRYESDTNYRTETSIRSELWDFAGYAYQKLVDELHEKTGDWSTNLACGTRTECQARARDELRKLIDVPATEQELLARYNIESWEAEYVKAMDTSYYSENGELSAEDYDRNRSILESYSQEQSDYVWGRIDLIQGAFSDWYSLSRGDPDGFVESDLTHLGYWPKTGFNIDAMTELLRPVMESKPLKKPGVDNWAGWTDKSFSETGNPDLPTDNSTQSGFEDIRPSVLELPGTGGDNPFGHGQP